LGRTHRIDLVAFVQESWVTTLFPSLAEGLEQSHQALRQLCSSVTFLPIDKVKRPCGKHLTGLQALLSGGSYSGSWLVSSRGRRAIGAQLSSASYDLIHFDTIGLAPYRELADSVPATLTHHNVESHMMLRRAGSASNAVTRAYFRHEGRKLRDLERRTASRFAAHITCSELDSARLQEIVPGVNTVVVPNGVDTDFFSPASAVERPNSLVFVGTMNWYPNVDAMHFFLREVWPALKQQLPAATLDIAGTNPPSSLGELARNVGGVTVHGYLPDVRPLIESSAVFICPIRDGGGTKLKILDAFAMRKCVVAHPIACEGIDVTPGRDVLLASSAEEFVAQIRSALADGERRRAVAAAARGLVEKQYSFRSIGAHFVAVLENVAGRSVRQR
jgi:glycosyltransferase involved in cell wall biosynthesis